MINTRYVLSCYLGNLYIDALLMVFLKNALMCILKSQIN